MICFRLFLSFVLLSSSLLYATVTGNPAAPDLLTAGIWKKRSSFFSFRMEYLDDWIYQARFCDEFKLEGVTHTRTFLELSTYAGSCILNFFNRIDVYGLVGSSRLQLDEEIFTKRAFSWGVGSKMILLKYRNFFIGADAKYFATDQKPTFFLLDSEAYNIVTDYRAKYEELQGGLGIAYRLWMFTPYINATYILTRIQPAPPMILVQLPDMNERVDVELKSLINKKKWGMALGFSLIDIKKASLSFEWRAFNQNAINVSGEIRF